MVIRNRVKGDDTGRKGKVMGHEDRYLFSGWGSPVVVIVVKNKGNPLVLSLRETNRQR